MGWNGTFNAEICEKNVTKSNYIHTYGIKDIFIHIYTHVYTYTHLQKIKIEDELYVVGSHGVELNH